MIEPFGSNSAVSTITKNGNEVGVQTFLGCTVENFSCNSSWDSQGGTCTINLVEDNGRLSKTAVVGSPQYFEIATTGNDLVFGFYGILQALTRDVSANGDRKYSATLQTPTVLLKSCSIITHDYAGAGDALEAVAPNTASSLPFGHLNGSVTWANVYNLLNAYGVYENDDYGQSTPVGFGASQVNDEGMRIDRFVSALDYLINTNGTTQLGRPIMYGADSWSSPVSPYYYTFDIVGFVNDLASYIPSNYRVRSTNLMDFVQELCDETNHIYMVDLLKPSGAGNPAIVGPNDEYATPPTNSDVGTFGGEIKIIVQDRNVYSTVKFPLASGIIPYEISDKHYTSYTGDDLPLDMAWEGGSVHPDGPPNASSPFGGAFPVEEITADDVERFLNTKLSVKLNDEAIAGKVVVGGYQSRIGFVPYSTSNVYQYWGEIKRLNNYGANANEGDTSNRGTPVVTKVLDPFDIVDCILIDCQDRVGNANISNVMHSGIYPTSMLETRYAMNSYEAWLQYMTYVKPAKLHYIRSFFNETFRQIRDSLYDYQGNYTYAGQAYLVGRLSAINLYNTAASSTDSTQIDCSDPLNSMANLTHDKFLKDVHEKIKQIGDEHYGKSWVVKQPAFAVKLDENQETVIANFVNSWDISDTAYLEPANFAAYEAPQHPYFVSDGRLAAYVNYDSNFTNSDIYGGYTVNYDFHEYKNERFAQTNISGTYVFSFLLDVEQKYLFLPTAYFTNYDRSNFTNLTSGGVIIDPANSVGIEASAVQSAVNYLFGASISENGVGMLPYALCKTNRVYPPQYKAASQGKNVNSIDNLFYLSGFACSGSQEREKVVGGSTNFFEPPAPIAITPRSFGIPQQSNRYVYGPWITNNISLDYAAKVEYELDPDLVPENYIIPSTITIGGTQYSLTSGLAGLNQVGQAKANSIDNFEYLFTENGEVTTLGLPSITGLAQALVAGGPLISDINVTFSTDVQTQYSMKTFVPKLGRTNKYIISQLGKLGKRIQSLGRR